MNETVFALTFVLLLLAPLAIAGVALINTGLGRSRSAAQALLGNLAILTVATVVFAVLGATRCGSQPGAPGFQGLSFSAAGKPWNWVGTAPFLLGGFSGAPLQAQLAVFFEFLAVGMAAILPWGSGADRWRLTGGCASAAILAGVLFPFAAHWTWGGGWLQQLGVNFGLGAGFLDGGGAGTVHVLGGMAALAVVWIAGPRRGKFPQEGLSTAMPGHNAVYVLFGSLLALVGWMAWNTAGAVLWLHAPLSALPITALNTLFTAAGALAATYGITSFRFGKPDASLCANGWLTGLVASCATAGVVTPGASLLIGAIAGVITPLLVEVMELALSIDDPSGAISVHFVGGLWGLFSAGVFSAKPGQLVAQMVGIATLVGLFLPLTYLLFAVLSHWVPFRVDPDGERIGMDLHELGGGAYPEFVIHRDESYR